MTTFLSPSELSSHYGVEFDGAGLVEASEFNPELLDLHWTTLSAWHSVEQASKVLNWGADYSSLVFELTESLRKFWKLPEHVAAFVVDCEAGEPLSGEALSKVELSELYDEFDSAMEEV